MATLGREGAADCVEQAVRIPKQLNQSGSMPARPSASSLITTTRVTCLRHPGTSLGWVYFVGIRLAACTSESLRVPSPCSSSLHDPMPYMQQTL